MRHVKTHFRVEHLLQNTCENLRILEKYKIEKRNWHFLKETIKSGNLFKY